MSLQPIIDRARQLVGTGRRQLLGITGAPGAGTSTVAERVVAALGADAVLVPMDGFHLADSQLDRLGLRDRKGAPDTFDAAGFVSLLRRLSEAGPDTVYAPVFDRGLEAAIAGSIAVPPSTALVVTEGNYLLLDDGPWRQVRSLLDEAWFVTVDPALRVERLIARHVAHGRSPAAAMEWVLRSDETNAALVERTRNRADLVVDYA
jgi:pantothenate kinase